MVFYFLDWVLHGQKNTVYENLRNCLFHNKWRKQKAKLYLQHDPGYVNPRNKPTNLSHQEKQDRKLIKIQI